ncbi:hypothetical protein PsYK624_020010 [Phanerochaete sordida]|uniref:Uncharacterized protein n=1 Tax=Phanerochaete sordida TaxID=48140 RepID=A0A9P3G0E7_9APHY|nr:hypothetical protein PsYK624_020010 [Phanerochaete sordida]
MASDGIQWTKGSSRKGVEFEIGVRAEAAAAGGDAPAPQSHGDDFGMKVQWPVENKWVDLPRDQEKMSGIDRVNVSTQSGSVYDYRFSFVNNQTYDYHFHDETGDSYRVNTYSVGEHFFRFNSKKPTIVYVTGS